MGDLSRCMVRFSGHEGVEGLHTCPFHLFLQERKLEKFEVSAVGITDRNHNLRINNIY
jgi:hypothetical protein